MAWPVSFCTKHTDNLLIKYCLKRTMNLTVPKRVQHDETVRVTIITACLCVKAKFMSPKIKHIRSTNNETWNNLIATSLKPSIKNKRLYGIKLLQSNEPFQSLQIAMTSELLAHGSVMIEKLQRICVCRNKLNLKQSTAPMRLSISDQLVCQRSLQRNAS